MGGGAMAAEEAKQKATQTMMGIALLLASKKKIELRRWRGE